jgi:glycosyltransferase involved in cell wall biosynthesis
LKILYVYADTPRETNCSLFNAYFPAQAINKVGNGNAASVMFLDDFVKNNEETQRVVSAADIIIVERNLFGDTLTMMQYWKSRNKPIAVIFDDGYHTMEKDNVSYDFWENSTIIGQDEKGQPKKLTIVPPILTQFKWGLKMAKGIICPSQVLCDHWSYLNKTYRTWNYLNLDRYVNSTPLYPHDDIVIGWPGSMSHLASFNDSGIAGALVYVARKYNNVRIMIGGDKRVYDRIHLPENKKFFSNHVPEDQWSQLLASIDIGLAPLAGEYDTCRSWIKGMEYMAMKIPWIASDYPTYAELKKYGTLTANGLDNWKKALCYVIENIEQEREKARTTNYDFALTKTWEGNVDKLIDIFTKIINSDYQN